MDIRRFVTPVAAILTLTTLALGADWPRYRGPDQDGKTPEAIKTDWPAEGPRVLWKVPLGNSLGTFAAVGDRAYVFVSREGQEGVQALDANTGKEQWFTPVGKTIADRQGGNGPRTTPNIVGDKVYALSTYFNLVCLDAKTGKKIWGHDLAATHEAQNGTNGIVQWGNAMSPLVEGNLVIVAGGGPNQTFLAFNKDTGALAWKAGNEKVTHATATPATIHGVRQVIFFVQSGLVSIEPQTGKELWRFAFPFNVSSASSPIVGGENGDIVYCAAAYNMGSGACKVTKDGDAFKATELWRLKGNENGNHWTTPVHIDGHVYGLYGHRGKGEARLECRDIQTGGVKWSEPAVAAGGATTVAGKTLIVQHEDGKIVLVDPSPSGYRKLAEAQPLKGKAWSMAVVSNGRMYARTDKEGVCLDVAAERSAGAQ
jgi:outer membrane protein assembly factor BamB